MTAFLAGSVVAVALAAIGAALYTTRRVLSAFEWAEHEHRLERAAVVRALIARSGTDLARMETAAGRVGNTQGADPRRHIDEAEFAAMIAADRAQGLGDEVGDYRLEGV